MHELGIDVETFSSVSLKNAGTHQYVKSPDFELLLFGYSLDGAKPIVIDIANGEEIPKEIILALSDPNYLKTAWNAPFEIQCLSSYLMDELPADQWECTMVRAGMLGYPMSLDEAGIAMMTDVKKSRTGRDLIKYFTIPCKPVKGNNMRTRNLPSHDPIRWKAFKEYNEIDVMVEQKIRDRLKFFKISNKERAIWLLDQKINNKGVKIDIPFVNKVLKLHSENVELLMNRAIKLTGLANPNSVPQLKMWLESEILDNIDNLQKENVKELISNAKEENIKEVLEIRQELAKTSIKKYKSMTKCADNECMTYGLLQYYGANKTGRWTGRYFQIHNLTKSKMEPGDLDIARNTVLQGKLDDLEMLYGNVSDTLSQLVRTAIIPREGYTLLATDLSAIEARVLAWFADEEWRLKVFRSHGKIYEASGAQMFKIPIEKVVGDIRFKAKTAELALGFQGGVGAIVRMEQIGLKTGLKPEERQPLVNLWRANNKKIVQFWYDIEEAAIEAVANPGTVVQLGNKLKFTHRHQTLFIQLPSGRFIAYVKPFLKTNKFGRTAMGFYGLDQDTHKWCKQDTYGGKLTENVVQGTSRDVLAEKMLLLDAEGFDIRFHVHDEAVMEVPDIEKDHFLKKAGEIMSRNIPWAKGLPLKAKSFTTPYYIKD